jgi:hypothetical protein
MVLDLVRTLRETGFSVAKAGSGYLIGVGDHRRRRYVLTPTKGGTSFRVKDLVARASAQSTDAPLLKSAIDTWVANRAKGWVALSRVRSAIAGDASHRGPRGPWVTVVSGGLPSLGRRH